MLRNAENLYVPAHHYATTKRFLLFTFPSFWNEAVAIKLNPSQHVFLRNVKSAIVKLYYCVMFTNPPPPPPNPPPTPPPPAEQHLSLNCMANMVTKKCKKLGLGLQGPRKKT